MVGSANALDISSQGVIQFDGAHSFTAPSLSEHGIIVGSTNNGIKSLGVATNGQLAIGSTGSDMVLATLTSTDGSITITNGAGSIDLKAESSGSTPTGALQYFATSGGSSISGWLKCDGSIVAQATYTSLYAQMGLINPPDTVWTVETPNFSQSGSVALAYGNSTYIAAGNGQGSYWIQTSTDAITWSVSPAGTFSNAQTISALTYGNGIFVYGAGSGKLGTSTNGSTWTVFTPTTSSISSLIYGTVYIGALNNQYITSTDAVTWTLTNGMGNTFAANSLAYGNSIYVGCGGNGSIVTSTNGSVWNTRSPTITTGQCIGYGTKFFGCSSNGCMATSTDGITWTGQYVNTSSTLQSVIYGLSTYVTAGAGGIVFSSTDAVTWTSRTSGTSSAIFSLAFGNSLFVYAGAGGVLQTSTDATTWNSKTSGTSSSILCMTYGTVYVYGGNGGVLASSTDATTWNSRTSGTSSSILALLYGNSTYVYCGINGVIASSTDATTWTVRTAITGTNLRGLAYGNSTFVACGDSGYIATSTDATTWTIQNSSSTSTLGSITFQGSNFYVSISSSNSGGLLTSTNGISWSRLSSTPTHTTLNSVTFGNGLFVVGGAYGYLATSTDGFTWNQKTVTFINPSTPIQSLSYGNGKFMLGSATSSQNIVTPIIATSTDGTTWYTVKTNFSSFGLNPNCAVNSLVYGSKWVGLLTSSSVFASNIITANTTYSYDTSTQFALPTDNSLAITQEGFSSFSRSLYIKT